VTWPPFRSHLDVERLFGQRQTVNTTVATIRHGRRRCGSSWCMSSGRTPRALLAHRLRGLTRQTHRATGWSFQEVSGFSLFVFPLQDARHRKSRAPRRLPHRGAPLPCGRVRKGPRQGQCWRPDEVTAACRSDAGQTSPSAAVELLPKFSANVLSQPWGPPEAGVYLERGLGSWSRRAPAAHWTPANAGPRDGLGHSIRTQRAAGRTLRRRHPPHLSAPTPREEKW